MNERINEFIKQSYVTVQSPSGEGYTHFSQEKFAELMVKECAAYVEGTGNWLVAMEMKEHFGVEE